MNIFDGAYKTPPKGLIETQIKNTEINAWNNYFEGTYLEPDEKYGYGSINALSKSLFDLPFKNFNYNISNLIENFLVAVQAHIFL